MFTKNWAFFRPLYFIWSLPITLIAFILALPILWVNGAWHWRADHHTWSVAFWGPVAKWLLTHHPMGEIAAITLGYVIIAQDQEHYWITEAHEHEHIRQFERWGVLFPAVYTIACAKALWSGQHYYLDNRFEVAARCYADHCKTQASTSLITSSQS